MQTNWDKVLSESQLVSLSEVYLKLQQLIDSDNYSLVEIAETIGLDPAVTTRLLRIVNSCFFGLAAKIDTVNRAINYLGAKQVHDLVLTMWISQTFGNLKVEDFDMKDFWKRSVYNAISAREIAQLFNVIDSERLFVTGLLADIGHLMMYQAIPELTLEARQLAQQKQAPLHLVEQEHIGFDYTAVGSALLNNWNLPESISDCVKNQLTPDKAESFEMETAILHLSGLLTQAYEQELPIENVLENANSRVLELTEFNQEDALAVDQQSREDLSEVFNLIFPSKH